MALISCSSCGGAVAENASFCPHCGERWPQVTPTNPAILFAIACAGVFVLLGVVAVNRERMSAGKPSWFGSRPPAAVADSASSTPASPPVRTTTLHVHAPMNVRSGPGTEHEIVRTLARGDSVRVAAADADGWAAVDGGGYVYRASDRLRQGPPPPDR